MRSVGTRALVMLLFPWPGVGALAQRPARTHPAPAARGRTLDPLTPRERAQQLLDRFTYGPRPGEVDRVLGEGADAWFEQQLHPGTIPDTALNKRLADLPTVSMTPEQALAVFPDRPQIAAFAQGKEPLPTDPLGRAVIEVQVAKWNAEKEGKQPDGTKAPIADASEADKAAQKAAEQATATRLAGTLLALPKEARMTAIEAMTVPDRIALTRNGNLRGEQREALLAGSTPREREAFLAMGGQVNSAGHLADELAQAHMLRDILSERQLETVMTDLWFNHFNVFIGKNADQWYTASYERDVIRPHALGKFGDLLLATATSPAMMVYLDNLESIGPNSPVNGGTPGNGKGKRGNRGLNENYGREVMELHTVGADGGYTQADVTALAAILTGWGVDQRKDGGPFAFNPKRHEPGAKAWFGYCISDTGVDTPLAGTAAAKACESGSATGSSMGSPPASPASMQQGITALKILAGSPKTAHFVATMLAQYFVADTPPPALVTRLTETYLATDGDISAILRSLVSSPEFNARQYFRNKVKTPVEFLASALRATGTDPSNPNMLVNQAKTMGMPLYYALPPTGYYLTADQWMNSTALVDRLNFAYQFTGSKLPNQRFDAPKLLATGLLAPGAMPPREPNPAPVPVSVHPSRSEEARLRTAAAAATTTGPREGERDGIPDVGISLGRPVAPDSGSTLATRVLEQTLTGGAVSAKTDHLIATQVAAQPATAGVTDILSLITGLLLGSPEFQLR